MVGTFYEFFAGGGMVRTGLGNRWGCRFANDSNQKKATTYALNWGDDNLVCEDVRNITTGDLAGVADLVWASFPCQDLSLAGGGAGLNGERSGTFWPFWHLMTALADVPVPNSLYDTGSRGLFHPLSLRRAFGRLPTVLKEDWLWWRLPVPSVRNTNFSHFLEDQPQDVPWHTPAETLKLLGMMSDLNLQKVRKTKRQAQRVVGTLYRRTRRDESGRKVQCAEVRFDGIAGCLRTPTGGSIRQLVLVVEGSKVRSRLISSRETARLMGLPDDYILPDNYNEAYQLTGDGVVVPVVRFLASTLIETVVLNATKAHEAA